MDEMPDQGEDPGVSRRRMMKRMGVAGAAAWAAPQLLNLNPAGAQTPGESGVNPNPECTGATCATFIPCSSTNPDCVCTTTSGGGGFCVPGSTSCGVTGDCGPGGTCPPGNVCVVETCCGRPVCAPLVLNDQCPPDPTPREGLTRTSTGAGTIGG